VTVDNGSPPTVSITAPAAGATVSGATVAINANAGDDRGVTSVQFRVDGTNLGAADTTSPYSATWNTTAATNGAHNLTAVALDSDGQTTTSSTVTVNVSNASTGLVAAFGFEETTGTTATDASGSGNTGTINGPIRSLTGKFGSALSFDGVNDQVNVPDANSLDLSNAMTLEAWVRPSVLSAWRTVLMKEQTAGLVYGLYANGDTNRPSVHIYTNAERDIRGTAAVPVNAWTHVAATYDGAVLRFFVNGTQVSTSNVAGTILASTGQLRIGGNNIWGEWFSGLIDEVRVYKRTLTAAEIQADMNAPVTPSG
jgi:concanavalin A-like lectin/glucanase superfamily protein/Big-like domain-containing protein